jgi:hypothetical protein
MATMALPVRELELSVCVGTEKARAETECVVFYSQARAIHPSMAMTLKLGFTASLLKFLLHGLVRHQKLLISTYQHIDFTRFSSKEISRVATSLDAMVEKGRQVLEKLATFGPRGQAWWASSVPQLTDQLDHMESIAQSLHIAADPEASLLLGLTVQQMAAD